MSNTFPFPSKEFMPWVKNVGKTIGTGFGIKVAGDCYNRMAENNYKRVVQKGENRKGLTATTKKIQEKKGGIEKSDLADAVKVNAVKVKIKEEIKEAVTEYAQTNLELGDTCKSVMQGIKMADAYPEKAATASLYHIASKDHLPGLPAKENGMILEYRDKNGNLLEGETLSTAFVPGDKSKATSQATIQVNDNKGKATIKVKEDPGKAGPSSFASISSNLPWQNADLSVTVTTLNIETGIIEQKLLSKQETKVFQGVLPERNYVVVKNPPRDFNLAGIVFVSVAFCSLVGIPLVKSLKKNIDSFFSSEK